MTLVELGGSNPGFEQRCEATDSQFRLVKTTRSRVNAGSKMSIRDFADLKNGHEVTFQIGGDFPHLSSIHAFTFLFNGS
ncbi:hypothetical protein CPC08DRAFT_716536 [Agrocybe pediades]|nr:hypothetical protein CPC08DRAFT_716536 [Agrocybe pediades]